MTSSPVITNFTTTEAEGTKKFVRANDEHHVNKHITSILPIGCSQPDEFDALSKLNPYSVPKWKKIGNLLAAGTIFGFAALKPILIKDGVYRNLCSDSEIEHGVNVCFYQETRLNLMFTTAAVGTNVAALPVGAILDKYGPRICGIISSMLLVMGALSFAYGNELPYDGYFSGYLFLAIGGPFSFIPCLQLSNIFPQHSGLIMALLTGGFDCSSAVFLIYRILYESSGGIFGPSKFFLAYLVVPIFIISTQLSIMPNPSPQSNQQLLRKAQCLTGLDNQLGEDTALLGSEGPDTQPVVADVTVPRSVDEEITKEERKNRISGVWGALHGKTSKQQIISPWFILITIFTAIQMTRINYFVATIRSQYEFILGSYEEAVTINKFFDAALPLGGILAIPFIGIVLDNTSTTFALTALITMVTIIGGLGCLPYTWAAYSNVCLFVLCRPFYYTLISDFAAKVFGFKTFGTVYGLSISIAGLFNFTANWLDAIRHSVFHEDPLPINLLLLVVSLTVGAATCIFVGCQSRKMRDIRDNSPATIDVDFDLENSYRT
ncbi:BgTH12-05694 [Blumeria graminis f. sp. triticale]|uniref:BgTH12-05694 n=1 Tax=Blumeria graminis f. sp. triticale TaxID=1689686 RepID=A0A9W4DPJ0_BLUGR|nr:BgTH12-05694 [Blumeria graminis f. sp. triticale]